MPNLQIETYHTSESKFEINASVSFTYFHTIAARDSRSDGAGEPSWSCRALGRDWDNLVASDEFARLIFPLVWMIDPVCASRTTVATTPALLASLAIVAWKGSVYRELISIFQSEGVIKLTVSISGNCGVRLFVFCKRDKKSLNHQFAPQNR